MATKTIFCKREWDWMGHPRTSPSGREAIGDCYIRIAGRGDEETHIWHYCDSESGCCHQFKDEIADFSEAVACEEDIFWNYNIKAIKDNNAFVLVNKRNAPTITLKYQVFCQGRRETGAILLLATKLPDPPLRTRARVYGDLGIPSIVEPDSKLWPKPRQDESNKSV